MNFTFRVWFWLSALDFLLASARFGADMHHTDMEYRQAVWS